MLLNVSAFEKIKYCFLCVFVICGILLAYTHSLRYHNDDTSSCTGNACSTNIYTRVVHLLCEYYS